MKHITKLLLVVMVIINLGSQNLVLAFQFTDVDIKNLPEWQVANTSLGGTLLLSDSPEMVVRSGILYQDQVEGTSRLFFYHVNATPKPKIMDVLVENKGSQEVHMTVNQFSLGKSGYDWLAVGKETLTSYLGEEAIYQVVIPPGKVRSLAPSISGRPVLPNMLSHGIFDFKVDHPVTVTVLMMPMFEDNMEFYKNARVLPADEWHLRGTFFGANRKITSAVAYDPTLDGPVGLTLADNKIDSYLTGIDALDGTPVVNYGNYGVMYQIVLPSKNKGKIAYYLVPMGGYYAGAMGVNQPDVKETLAIPKGRTYFGSGAEKEFAFLGVYDSGDPLTFRFSPPGASNLPVKIVILPQGN